MSLPRGVLTSLAGSRSGPPPAAPVQLTLFGAVEGRGGQSSSNGGVVIDTTINFDNVDLEDSHIWVGNVSDVAVAVPVTGDVSLANDGEITIDNGAVTEVKLGFTDVVTANTTTLAHGLAPKLSGVDSEYLDGDGNWTVPPGGDTYIPLVSGVSSTGLQLVGNPSNELVLVQI